MDQGKLFDEVTIGIVERLSEPDCQGLSFGWVSRTVTQADALNEILPIYKAGCCNIISMYSVMR